MRELARVRQRRGHIVNDNRTGNDVDHTQAERLRREVGAPAIGNAEDWDFAAGGRVLVRGMPAKVYELGVEQRVVVIEFDSVEQAIAAHESPAYQEALRVLGTGNVERDMRIVPGG